MGLDISYYRKIVRLRDRSADDEYDYKREFDLYVIPEFAPQADGLAEGIYSGEDQDGFRAGSYSGYNRFREWLASLAGYTPDDAWEGRVADDAPFFPLVNFSDCEGVIGPQTSARLARDFALLRHKANGDDWDSNLYARWQEAFETAADGGCVVFH